MKDADTGLEDFNSDPLPLNEWSHVVTLYNGTHRAIYVNGAVNNSEAFTITKKTISSDVSIGTDYYSSSNRHFEGLIDEVKIYDRALSAEQILANYEAGLEGRAIEIWRTGDLPSSGDLSVRVYASDGLIHAYNDSNIVSLVPSCGVIDEPGTYTLSTDVAAAGTCFTINVSDVVLDCHGHTINYSTNDEEGYGILIWSQSDTVENVSIANCNIIKESPGGSSGSRRPAILGYGYSDTPSGGFTKSGDEHTVEHVSISNVTITTEGDHARGIFVLSGHTWSVEDVSITTYGDDARGVYSETSDYWNLSSVDITTFGTVGIGLYVIDANHYYLKDIDITAASAGMWIRTGSSNWRAENISINATLQGIATSDGGMAHMSFYNSTIHSSGSRGLDTNQGTDNISFYDSTITAPSSDDVYMRLGDASRRVSFVNVTFNPSSVTFHDSSSGFLDVGWWVDAYIDDPDDDPIEGVNISWADSGSVSGNPTALGWMLTDSQGSARTFVFEYTRNDTGVYSHNNYTFNITSALVDAAFLDESYEITDNIELYYTLGNATLAIWDGTKPQGGSNLYSIGLDVPFYAEYLRLNDSTPITTASCTIAFDSGSGYGVGQSMTYNASSEYYEYGSDFPSGGFYDYQVTCTSDYTGRTQTSTFGYGDFSVVDVELVHEEDYEVSYAVIGTPAYNTTDWRSEGVSLAVVNMPFTVNESSSDTGAVADLSTYHNNGTLINAPTWEDDCVIGGCYRYVPGSSQYIQIADSESLNFTDDMSFSVWIYRDGWSANWANIFSKGNDAYLLRRYSNTDRLYLTVWNATGGYFDLETTTNIDTGTWYHIAGVYSVTEDRAELYVNGFLEDSDPQIGPIRQVSDPMGLGARYRIGSGADRYWDGLIDGFVLYDRALSQEQIQAIYAAESQGRSVNTFDDPYDGSAVSVRVYSSETTEYVYADSNELRRFDQCGVIEEPGSYALVDDVSASGTCFTINVSDVTLDCNAHTIEYSTSSQGYGVFLWSQSGKIENITIRDCEIIKTDSGGSSSSRRPAILGWGWPDDPTADLSDIAGSPNWVEDVLIENVSIDVVGDYSPAIRTVRADSWTIRDSQMVSSGVAANTIRGFWSPNFVIDNISIEVSGNIVAGISQDSNSHDWIVNRTYIEAVGAGQGTGLFAHYSHNLHVLSTTVNVTNADKSGIEAVAADGVRINDSRFYSVSGSDDLYLNLMNTNRNMYVVNTTFDDDRISIVSDGTLHVGWRLDLYVNDTLGNPRVAEVNYTDAGALGSNPTSSGTSLITDADGFYRNLVLYEYSETQSTTYTHTDYEFDVSSTGVLPSLGEARSFSESTQLNFTLELSELSECGVIDASGDYLLTQDVSASGTCFTINVSNVSLYCQGHTINYSQSSEGYGILIWSQTSSVENVLIHDCNIIKESPGGATGSRRPAILGYGFSDVPSGGLSTGVESKYYVEDVTISNVTITTDGNFSRGIYANAARYWRVEDVSITTKGDIGARGIYTADDSGYWNISRVDITIEGENEGGMYIWSGDHYRLIDIDITSAGVGIWGRGGSSYWYGENVSINATGSGIETSSGGIFHMQFHNFTIHSSGSIGVYMKWGGSDNITFYDSQITAPLGDDVRLNILDANSRIGFVNVSFNPSSVFFSGSNAGFLDVGWWVEAYVNSTEGFDVPGAVIEWDDAGILASNPSATGEELTGSGGTARFAIFEYSENHTSRYYHANYTFEASKGGDPDILSYNVTDNVRLNFTIEAPNSELAIFDGTTPEGGENFYPTGVDMPFYANYTSVATGNPISGVGNACEIAFDTGSGLGSYTSMTFDAGSGLYTYTRSFSQAGEFLFLYRVECTSTTGFDDANATRSFTYGFGITDIELILTSGVFNVTYSTPESNFVLTNTTDWRIDNESIAVLNMPFNLNESSLESDAIFDYSSHENHGRLGNGVGSAAPEWEEDCIVGGCYSFDGSQHIRIPHDSSLDISDEITLEAWIYPTAVGQSMVSNIIGKPDTTSAGRQLYSMAFNSARQIRWRMTDTTNRDQLSDPIPLNEWSHVVTLYNGTHRAIYLNGELNRSEPFSITITTLTSDVSIGTDYFAPGNRYFEGLIDEVKIYPVGLTAEQVQANYQAGLVGRSIDTWDASLVSGTDPVSVRVYSGTEEFVVYADSNEIIGLNTCGVIDEAGAYGLVNNVSAAGTCFTITSSDVSLDCAGHLVNYSTTSSGRGVIVNQGLDNITVRNCILNQHTTNSDSGGIYAVGAGADKNTNFFFENIVASTRGTNSRAIQVYHTDNLTLLNVSGYTEGGSDAAGATLFENRNVTIEGGVYEAQAQAGFEITGGATQNYVVRGVTAISHTANFGGMSLSYSDDILLDNVTLSNTAGSGVNAGLVIGGDPSYNIRVWNSSISGGNYPIIRFTPGNLSVYNTVLESDPSGDAYRATQSGTSHAYFVNTTHNNDFSLSWGSGTNYVHRGWWVDVYVNDTSGNDIEGATIEWEDIGALATNPTSSGSVLTGPQGHVRTSLFEYTATSSSTTSHNNYTINASYDGEVVSSSHNITDNDVIRFTMDVFTASPPTFYHSDGTLQLAFNNVRYSSIAPVFRLSSDTSDSYDTIQVELNSASDFSGSAYIQTFPGSYESNTQYNVEANDLSPALPTTENSTYYVRARVSWNGGTDWSEWSDEVWTYTYKSGIQIEWYQQNEAPFGLGGWSGIYYDDGLKTSMGGDAPEDWYNGSWQHRTPIIINSSEVDDDLVGFPVLISSTVDEWRHTDYEGGVGKSDGTDILFTDSDGTTMLAHEIQQYNASTGELIAWVRIPQMNSSSDKTIFLYYGNESVSDQQNRTGVWDDDFGAVWHLTETTASSGSIKDSTSNENDGTPTSTILNAQGKIGRAVEFNGTTSENIEFPNDASINFGGNVTVSAWIYATVEETGSPYRDFVDNEVWQSGGWVFRYGDSYVRFQVLDGTSHGTVDNQTLALNTWVYFVGTLSGSTLTLYRDGHEVHSISGAGMGSTARDVQIGRGWGQFGGRVDEVRISSVPRSASWILTEYNNQENPERFYSLGEQETLLGGTGEGNITSQQINHSFVPAANGWGSAFARGNSDDGNITLSVLDAAMNPISGKNCTMYNGATSCSIDLKDIDPVGDNATLHLKAHLVYGEDTPILTSWGVSYEGIHGCGVIDEAGSYALIDDVSASGTCFTINTSDVSLDCSGYTINYSQSSVGYGILVTGGNSNINISNCGIFQGGTSSDSRGILLNGSASNTINNIVIDNIEGDGRGLSNINILTNATNNINVSNINLTNSGEGGVIILFTNNTNISLKDSYGNCTGADCVVFYMRASSNSLSTNLSAFSSASDSYLFLFLGGTNNTLDGFIGNNTGAVTYGSGSLAVLQSYTNATINNATVISTSIDSFAINSMVHTVNVTNSYFSTSSGNDIGVWWGTNKPVIYLINTTYEDININSDSEAILHRGWYIDFFVNDTLGNPVDDANVSWNDAGTISGTPSSIGWNITDGSGLSARNILYQYSQNFTNRYYHTNYTFNAIADGYVGLFGESRNFTGNAQLNFTLSLDLEPPQWSNNWTNETETTPRYGESLRFNLTMTDDVALDSFIFSWNGTGVWTYDDPVSMGGVDEYLMSIVKTDIELVRGQRFGWKVYFNDTSGKTNETPVFNVTMKNTPPPAPVLDYPADNEEFLTNRTPRYNWTQEPDIDGDTLTFEWQLALDEDFTSITATNTTSNEYYDQIAPLDFTTYWWRVRANDSINVSEWSEPHNFTVTSLISIELVNATPDFGNMSLGDVNDTTNHVPPPITVRNTGNIDVNLSINASELWIMRTLDTSFFQAKARESQIGAFDTGSLTYLNLSSVPKELLENLRWEYPNEAYIDIRVQAPLDEYPGARNSTLRVIAS